jgi:hypothetical protein
MDQQFIELFDASMFDLNGYHAEKERLKYSTGIQRRGEASASVSISTLWNSANGEPPLVLQLI